MSHRVSAPVTPVVGDGCAIRTDVVAFHHSSTARVPGGAAASGYASRFLRPAPHIGASDRDFVIA
jgi:hypothetical protein